MPTRNITQADDDADKAKSLREASNLEAAIQKMLHVVPKVAEHRAR